MAIFNSYVKSGTPKKVLDSRWILRVWWDIVANFGLVFPLLIIICRFWLGRALCFGGFLKWGGYPKIIHSNRRVHYKQTNNFFGDPAPQLYTPIHLTSQHISISFRNKNPRKFTWCLTCEMQAIAGYCSPLLTLNYLKFFDSVTIGS